MVFEFEQLAQKLLLQRRQCAFNHIISSNQANAESHLDDRQGPSVQNHFQFVVCFASASTAARFLDTRDTYQRTPFQTP